MPDNTAIKCHLMDGGYEIGLEKRTKITCTDKNTILKLRIKFETILLIKIATSYVTRSEPLMNIKAA